MAEDQPNLEEFAARQRPCRPPLIERLRGRPDLVAELRRLHDEFDVGWRGMAEWLTLRGVPVKDEAVRRAWPNL